MTTIYKNAGVELYIDEADAYTPEEIRAHYSQFDKTLLQATYTVTKGEGEAPTVVEFAKKDWDEGRRNPRPRRAAAHRTRRSALPGLRDRLHEMARRHPDLPRLPYYRHIPPAGSRARHRRAAGPAAGGR